MTDQPTQTVISYVIPAHNSAGIIEACLAEIADRLRGDSPAEVIVVENGSTDDTPSVLSRLARRWVTDPVSESVELRVLTSAKGLGHALRVGIAASRGDRVVITADDLPFGFDELTASTGVDLRRCPVVIGSKAHPASDIGRSPLRRILTVGFQLLRWLVLGMRTGDPQGTYVLDGRWARAVVGGLREPGFLITTELSYVAELSGIRPVEVPVRLRPSHDAHGSRVGFVGDAWRMALALLDLRRRRLELRALGRHAAPPGGRAAADRLGSRGALPVE